MLYISLSANHRHLDKIVEKAKSLKAKFHDEAGWGNDTRRSIKVFTHSDALWSFILELEPTVEDIKKAKRAKSMLLSATPDEILDYGFEEPGKK